MTHSGKAVAGESARQRWGRVLRLARPVGFVATVRAVILRVAMSSGRVPFQGWRRAGVSRLVDGCSELQTEIVPWIAQRWFRPVGERLIPNESLEATAPYVAMSSATDHLMFYSVPTCADGAVPQLGR